jgi:dTDP-4-dehydrorhamnose 3,5-epimerase-like enzyme
MKLIEYNAHEDHRGRLFELFRLTDYPNIKMAYAVTINPGQGRDWIKWHFHNMKTEMFICLKGKVWIAVKSEKGDAVALYPLMDNVANALLVEPTERHSVVNLGDRKESATVLVLCDQYYTPEDEHREPISHWDWDEYLEMLNG